MTIIAIGYAFSQDPTSQSHIAPILFYQEPELSHLTWINTIYPKCEDPAESLPNCLLQLKNYIAYYQEKQTVVIGGDESAIEGTLLAYKKPLTIYLYHPKPQSIKDRIIALDPNALIVDTANLTVSDPQNTQILAVDAGYFLIKANEGVTLPNLLRQLSGLKFNTIIITGYTACKDPSKSLFNALKTFISGVTS